MARASIWLKKFNRDAEFVVSRAFLLSGNEMRPGQPFNKTLVSVRMHRCLYDHRKIQMVDRLIPRVVVAPLVPVPPPSGLTETLIARTVAHVGRGKFVVMRGEVRLTELMTKDEAESELTRLNAIPPAPAIAA
jgi:hypothetical protein